MSKQKLKVLSPYDEHLIAELPLETENDVNEALTVARALADDPSRRIPTYERIEILEKTIALIEEDYESIVNTAAEEGGKPLIDTRVEITRAMNGIRVAIDTLGHMGGEEIPMGLNLPSANRMAFTIREPIGVVVAVSAFNHPFNLIVHQVVAAVAVGCPVIVKPASTTPLSCLALVQKLYDAGLPKEWCRVLICRASVAEKLVTDPRVDFFSFIGSARVGWSLRSKLSPGVRCALEHGGVAPVILEADADLDDALPLLVKGGFYHAGQVCVSVQRLFVHESVVDEVAGRMTEMAQKLKVGDPLSAETEVGPLIQRREVDRVHDWVTEAVDKGARLLGGGNKIGDTCYEPTVLLDPPQDSTISQNEVFGPVVSIYPYKDREEAIRLANSIPYSFQASVFTKDIDAALDTVKKINAAAVMINDHTAFRVDWMPFAGHKASGYGIGGIPYTMGDMTHEKLIVFRSKAL